MQLTCPDCQVECTFDEESAATVSCPGCGVLLYSKSGNSGPLAAQLAIAGGQRVEITNEDLERTRQWQKSIDDILPAPDQFPQRMGRYELKQKLGEGSFAEVYLAFDSGLGREVALKIPKRNRFSSAEQLRRFLDEGRTSAILEHPGIVRVYDIGWISEEICFISMEYCPGGSLSDRLKTDTPTCAQAVELVESLADAIHFAHVAGFVHRDLKPSNVMIGRDGRPRIVDFGLALSDAEQLDHAGEVAGTLPYMSPEQIRGDAHHLDGRTDIWSLGVILYQMLVGRRPFSGSKSQIFEQIRNRDAKPLRQIKDGVPAELETICLRCLQKSPAERYATAKDLAQDLRRIRQQRIPQVVPMTEVSLQRPQPKSQFAWLGFSILILLGCMAVLWATFGLMGYWNKPSGVIPPKFVDPNRYSPPLLVHKLWYSLLETRPVEFFWPSDSPPWEYKEDRQIVVADNRYPGFLELGKTDCKNFEVELRVSKSDWSGGRFGCGFYWGLHEVETGWQGFLFEIASNVDPKHHNFMSEVHFLKINKDFLIGGEYFSAQNVERPQSDEHQICLVIGEKGLMEARWDGERLDFIPVYFAQNFHGPYQSQGRFGIYNRSGATVFRDVRFMSR